jgi:hypothetical protein
MNFSREDIEFLAEVFARTNGHDKPADYAKVAGAHFDELAKAHEATHEPPKEG